jgi:hypothetical protein
MSDETCSFEKPWRGQFFVNNVGYDCKLLFINGLLNLCGNFANFKFKDPRP